MTASYAFQRNPWDVSLRIGKYLNLLTRASVGLLAGSLVAQTTGPDIRVVSQIVGATIDIPEQEYYRIFDRVEGFLSAQFLEVDGGFEARIRTERGRLRRAYSSRRFYDLGLAIDLRGPIDPLVLAVLSGQIAFEETVAHIERFPRGVVMAIYRDKAKPTRGVFEGFEDHHFYLKGRRGRIKKVPIEGLVRLRYRDFPMPALEKDVRITAGTALAGLLAAAGYNRLAGVNGFADRWQNHFVGSLLGLAVSPVVVQWFRIKRAPVHHLKISPETREKIKVYTFIRFN